MILTVVIRSSAVLTAAFIERLVKSSFFLRHCIILRFWTLLLLNIGSVKSLLLTTWLRPCSWGLLGASWGPQYSRLNTQGSTPNTQYSILNTQKYWVFNTQHSILNTQYSLLTTRYSILNTPQYSILNTPQYYILNTQYSLQCVVIAFLGAAFIERRVWKSVILLK